MRDQKQPNDGQGNRGEFLIFDLRIMIGSEERSYRVAGPEAGAPSKIHPRTTARMVCAPMVTKVREGSDCFTKVREVSRKFAQIRPVNPRCYALLRVRLIFRQGRREGAIF